MTQRASDIELKVASDNTLSLGIFAGNTMHQLAQNFTRRADGIRSDDVDRLSHIFRYASKFYGELKRCDNNPLLSQRIDVEFYELTDDLSVVVDADTSFHLPVLMPRTNENLLQDGTISLRIPQTYADSGPAYGVKVTNKSNVDLFVSMFYFVNSDLSIST